MPGVRADRNCQQVVTWGLSHAEVDRFKPEESWKVNFDRLDNVFEAGKVNERFDELHSILFCLSLLMKKMIALVKVKSDEERLSN